MLDSTVSCWKNGKGWASVQYGDSWILVEWVSVKCL